MLESMVLATLLAVTAILGGLLLPGKRISRH